MITQPTEHPAVLGTCRALQRLHGVQVTYLPVDRDGLVDPAALETAITPSTVLVSIMAANSETGVLQPIAELAGIAHPRGVLFHTDAAQAAGKIPLNAASLERRPSYRGGSQAVRAQRHRRPVCPCRCAAGACRLRRWAGTRAARRNRASPWPSP